MKVRSHLAKVMLFSPNEDIGTVLIIPLMKKSFLSGAGAAQARLMRPGMRCRMRVRLVIGNWVIVGWL